MLKLGTAFKEIRTMFGATQTAMADMVGCSVVHLCNVEHDKNEPSRDLCSRFSALTGVDPYIYAWATQGDVERLPKVVREPARKLAEAWRSSLERSVGALMLNRAGK